MNLLFVYIDSCVCVCVGAVEIVKQISKQQHQPSSIDGFVKTSASSMYVWCSVWECVLMGVYVIPFKQINKWTANSRIIWMYMSRKSKTKSAIELNVCLYCERCSCRFSSSNDVYVKTYTKLAYNIFFSLVVLLSLSYLREKEKTKTQKSGCQNSNINWTGCCYFFLYCPYLVKI